MKSLFSILTIALLFFSSCKKDKDPEPTFEYLNGTWSCDFNVCVVSIDSSLSIFSHVSDLTFSGVQGKNVRGSFSWTGCIDGSGVFDIAGSDLDSYDLLIIPKSESLTEVDENLNLVPASFAWASLLPSGAVPDKQTLNTTKIYIKKISDHSFEMYILYPDGQTLSYGWVR